MTALHPTAAGAVAPLPQDPLAAPTRPQHTQRRHAVALLLCSLILLGLFATARMLQNRLQGLYPAFGLRFETTAITGQMAAGARRHASESDGDWWPTFWRQEESTVESELFSAKATCLSYSGQGSLVWPASFTAGGWSGATDDGGCVISRQLAHSLWGSEDVLGLPLTVEGRVYTVQGVFAGGEAVALLHWGENAPATGWTAAELVPGVEGATLQDAQTFALAAGLGGFTHTVNQNALLTASSLLCWLPVLVLLCALATKWLVPRQWRHSLQGRIMLFACAVLLALLLPTLLALLPAWLLPGKWSDFSFWSSLLAQCKEALLTILRMRPALRDVQAKLCGIALLAVSAFSTPLALVLARRLGQPSH